VNTYNPPHKTTGFVPLPQRIIEGLGRFQTNSPNTALSSIYIYDLVDQQTLYASCSVAAMLGYTADAIHDMGPIGLANLIHPDDLERVAAHYQRFTALLYGEVIAIEYRMQRADGAWCWLRSQETPLVQAIDGFPLQVLGIVQVMTPHPGVDTRRDVRLTRGTGRHVTLRRTDRSSIKRKRLRLSSMPISNASLIHSR
jgi:PAS domain S-box-containing protein